MEHFEKIDLLLCTGLKITPLHRRQYKHFEFNGPGCVRVRMFVLCPCVQERMFWGAV